MTKYRTYKWWMLVAVSLIGLTWLPVYGVETDSTKSSTAKESSQPTDAARGESMSSQPLDTPEDKDEQVTSPELTLAQQLEARGKELDEREQALAAEEQRLEKLRKDFEALAREHADVIAEAAQLREAKKKRDKIDPTQQSLAHLIKVYDAMDPEDAAVRLEKMKEPLALDILAGIKEKKAASMLAGVEPGKAARLTEGLRNYSKRRGNAKP